MRVCFYFSVVPKNQRVLFSKSYLPYDAVHAFSPLVLDYLNGSAKLQDFYSFSTDEAGIKAAMEHRKNHPVDRKKLHEVMTAQYANLKKSDKTNIHLDLLLQENTFTICTAHQPNLLTGYLYFSYKILHAIKLAEACNKLFPDAQFVPVYYMGSEDNDLAELGTFFYNNQKYEWKADGQNGAVGRMKTDSLKPLLDKLFKEIGPPGKPLDSLKKTLTDAYLKHENVADATHYLLNELFGKYGLLVLNADNAKLKKVFVPVMEEELLQQDALNTVLENTKMLAEDYKMQAHPRAINLFYLTDNLRERIEEQNGTWTVLNTGIQWNKEALLNELHQHPERFSPNVILRPLFQEMILPDVAFIGGGGEVAYWLQLKALFAKNGVFFPAIHLRQSVQWLSKMAQKKMAQLDISTEDVFKSEQSLIQKLIEKHTDGTWNTTQEREAMENIFKRLEHKAAEVDKTLKRAADAALTKMNKQLTTLEKKMIRAEKRKLSDKVNAIVKLKEIAFPSGKLQERRENFLPYYLQFGEPFFDELLSAMEPFKHQFLVMEEKN